MEQPDEELIKAKFYAEFSRDYLDRLDRDSTAKHSLVELVWMGYAHGYMAGQEKS